MKITIAAIGLLMIALAIPLAAAADGGANPNQRAIQVSGNGEAQAAPDLAVLSLAIETHAAEQVTTVAATRRSVGDLTHRTSKNCGNTGHSLPGPSPIFLCLPL